MTSHHGPGPNSWLLVGWTSYQDFIDTQMSTAAIVSPGCYLVRLLLIAVMFIDVRLMQPKDQWSRPHTLQARIPISSLQVLLVGIQQ